MEAFFTKGDYFEKENCLRTQSDTLIDYSGTKTSFNLDSINHSKKYIEKRLFLEYQLNLRKFYNIIEITIKID
ncbi:UNVERIFIED_CONTAM: hypothetical protein NCL1_51050 [Trichonephila clavipes]